MEAKTVVPDVYRAISAVQSELATKGIGKDGTNKQQGYKFRGIDSVYSAISSVLAKNGLCILPRVLNQTCEERVTKSGGALFTVIVETEFDIVSQKDGSIHTIRTIGEAMDTPIFLRNNIKFSFYYNGE